MVLYATLRLYLGPHFKWGIYILVHYFSYETDETFEEIGFYRNTSGEMEPDVSTMLSSEEEFWALQEELRDRVQEIELIPFSEYEPG